jgi:hypothetical protein
MAKSYYRHRQCGTHTEMRTMSQVSGKLNRLLTQNAICAK